MRDKNTLKSSVYVNYMYTCIQYTYVYHMYTTCIPHVYHMYTTCIPHVYHMYAHTPYMFQFTSPAFYSGLFIPFFGGCVFEINQDPNIVKLLARRDFMFSSSDLRGWDLKNDSALLVPGVTHVHHIPAPEKLKNNKVGMDENYQRCS